MKKALKIIIPILLALLVVFSIAWYLLIYDPGFTKDFLLYSARRQEEKGNHDIAVRLYHTAYDHSHQDEAVAMELASQFVSGGNYTKAEYTLTRAIANGPSARLYTALSKLYVEQDKLLDAVKMLDQVSDPKIKAELDAMRPQIPAAKPDSGFYSQYISVEIASTNGTLYVNDQGEYPSVRDSLYTGAITLPAGETTICALAVNEEGLVSKLGIFGYTVGGVIEPVSFKDRAIEKALRLQLNVKDDAVVTTKDLWAITEFEVPANAEHFDDLIYLPYLRTLAIHKRSSDLDVVSSLVYLENLDLSGSELSSKDLEVIGSLTKLKALNLSDTGLSTISGLENCTELQHLNLSENTIRNLSVLSSMKQLQSLNLSRNAVVDLSDLSSLSALQSLDISYNALTSLSPLTNCTALNKLNAAHNQISALENIGKMKALTVLDISENKIADISGLAECEALKELNISRNTVAEISGLASLKNLSILDFSYNKVTELPVWRSDSVLSNIDGSNNQLDNVDSLSSCQWLNYVYMNNNKLTSVDRLANCHRLIQIDLFGNNIEDVSSLTENSVIVHYSPV